MPTKFSGTVRQKIFDGNMWYPLLCIKVYRYPKLFESLKGCHQNFRHCETKSFRRKIGITSIMHKIFWYPKIFWNIEGMPTKFFGTVRQKISTETCDTPPPPLLCIKFFQNLKISETLKGCPWKFSALWDKKIRRKLVIHPIMHKIFR